MCPKREYKKHFCMHFLQTYFRYGWRLQMIPGRRWQAPYPVTHSFFRSPWQRHKLGPVSEKHIKPGNLPTRLVLAFHKHWNCLKINCIFLARHSFDSGQYSVAEYKFLWLLTVREFCRPRFFGENYKVLWSKGSL